jgi:hypothetical protein
MEPRRSVLAPDLERWVRAAPENEWRTAIVRIGYSSDPEKAAAHLSRDGFLVESVGLGSIIGLVTPPVLQRVAKQPWVLAVEEPTPLFPRLAERHPIRS